MIRRQLETLDEVAALDRSDHRVTAWESTTEQILNQAFGRPNGEGDERTSQFAEACRMGVFTVDTTEFEFQQYFVKGMQQRKALLGAFIDQLEILAPPAAQIDPSQYAFHPEIERVAGALYRDGYYKQAALEAYIRVILAVREKSGLPEDGDRLMNHAFGHDNRTPKIQFNTLTTQEERDEQTGFLYLFKAVVALRNSKAHTNRLFDDPARAHEYLALASVFMRVLEAAIVNP